MALKVKKRFFYFKKFSDKFRMMYIHLRKTHSNIFVTVTDLKYNVLKCVTSGSSGVVGTKRQKKAPMVLESIVRKFLPVLELYKVRRVKVILKSKISILYYTLLKELKFHGITVLGLKVRRKIAFNGVRKRKLRRI